MYTKTNPHFVFISGQKKGSNSKKNAYKFGDNIVQFTTVRL